MRCCACWRGGLTCASVAGLRNAADFHHRVVCPRGGEGAVYAPTSAARVGEGQGEQEYGQVRMSLR